MVGLFVQVHFGVDSQFSDESILCLERGRAFLMGNLITSFWYKRGGQRALPAPAISQTLSTQNNQWDKVAYSDSFSEECLQASPTLLHPKSLSSRTGSLTLSK